MKALSIKQPWASLIIFRGKDIENREWAAPQHYIGQRIAIHASKAMSLDDIEDATTLCYERGLPDFNLKPMEYTTGAIIGTVLLTDCVKASDSPWFVGTYGFVLADPLPLAEPYKIRGQLGFWDVPPYIAETIRAAQGASL